MESLAEMKNLRCCREDGGFRFLEKFNNTGWQFPGKKLTQAGIETQDLWCASPHHVHRSRRGFPEACCCLSAPSQSASHTYIICISSSEGGAAGLEEFSLSRMREIDKGQGGGAGEQQGPVTLCTGWEDNAAGCGDVPGSQWGRMQSATALLDWSLWYCTRLGDWRAEAAPLWLTFDPGGKNSKEWMSEGPGKWLSGVDFSYRWFH